MPNRIATAIRESHPGGPASDRRLIAVGILGRTAGRTVSTVRTADGTTGTVTPAVKR